MTGHIAEVELRPPAAHELDAFASCVEAAFAFHFPPEEREQFLAGLDANRCLVAFEEAAIVATLASHLVELTLPGPRSIAVAALTDLGVAPMRRGRGLGQALVARFLADCHRRGEALSLLEARAGGYYARAGFGVASWAARYRLAPRRPDTPMASSAGKLVLLSAYEQREGLPGVFDRYRRAAVGEITRTPERWRELLGEDKVASERWIVVAHLSGQEIDGYCRYRAEMSPEGRVIVLDELTALNDAAYQALYSMLAHLDAAEPVRTGPRPTDEPARHLLGDPGALETLEVRDRSWLRLVDVQAALALRRYRGPGTIVFHVTDAICPWNEASYLLSCDEAGSAAVSRTDEDTAELHLDVAALATIYLGATSLQSLVRAGRVRERRDGAAARADLLFAVERPPFQSAGL